MSEPFLAEIRIVGFNFAPEGWALCDGQILPINQNQSLYSLLGITYGGDGQTSFGLPDLRGRTPIHVDGDYPLGRSTGEEAHSLSLAEMPQHTHMARASADAATEPAVTGAGNEVLATAGESAYQDANNLTSLATGNVSNAGGNQAHTNMQPFITLNFCIALQGLFPSRN